MTAQARPVRRPSASASTIAHMLVPPCEARKPSCKRGLGAFMILEREVEAAAINHALAARFHDMAQLGHGLASVAEDRSDVVCAFALNDDDHADAAVEGAQHFE